MGGGKREKEEGEENMDKWYTENRKIMPRVRERLDEE
jgi:hypothetical protein